MTQTNQPKNSQINPTITQTFSQQVSLQQLVDKGLIVDGGKFNHIAQTHQANTSHKNTNHDLIINTTGALNTAKTQQVVQSFEYSKTSRTLSIGIDEAGRGPLLGSVVVAAAILLPEHSGEFGECDLTQTELASLNDSKKLSEKKRTVLDEVIKKNALAYAMVEVPAGVIDVVNILQASLLGMRLAGDVLLQQLSSVLNKNELMNLSIQLHYDGNKLPLLNTQQYAEWGYQPTCIQHTAVIKGDGKLTDIAAASVLAKVTRDDQMYELAKEYPDYGIDKHKGYPTKQHFAMLEKYGVLPEHRRSFAPVKRLL